MIRSEMAEIIRKVATGTISDSEWQSAMVNHYEDIELESARALTVRIRQEHPGLPDDDFRSYLNRLAQGLEADVNPGNFYFRGGAAGILRDPIRNEGCVEIGYEPYRSGSHYDFVTTVDRDGCACCEFMDSGKRRQFKVLGLPSYGRLLVETKPS